jgi:hypothetical protein
VLTDTPTAEEEEHGARMYKVHLFTIKNHDGLKEFYNDELAEYFKKLA